MFRALFRVKTERSDLLYLGSTYGGWWVPAELLGRDAICYTGGVGTDISFDLGLIEQFGCRVFGIDPTPRSIKWVREQLTDDRFTLVEVGLAGETGELHFYEPRDPSHASFSVKNLQCTSSYVSAHVQTVRDLMRELGHERIDLIKLDIEGAEHDTIRRMLADQIRPAVVCVEFDQPEPICWSLLTVGRLRRSGYVLVKVDRFNLTFVLMSCPEV